MKKGFTLIELLVVIAIISLLASVVIASLRTADSKGANAAVKSELKQLGNQMNLDYATGSTYAGLCASAKEVAILDNASMSGAGNTTSDGCGDSASQYAAWAPLKLQEGTYTYWCTDSTNIPRGENSAPVAGSTACP